MSTFDAGMLNPVEAFSKILYDLMQVVSLYNEDDTPLTDEDFLSATYTAGERMKAICMFTMAGIMTPVAGKVDPEVRRDFDYQRELEDAAMSEEDRQRRMLKTLRSITEPPH